MPCLQLDRTSCPGKLLIRFGYNPVLIDAVKSVGCRWCPSGKETGGVAKVWWTSDPKIIALLEQCADMDNPRDVHKQLAATRKASVEASYQSDTTFQPPVPVGTHPLTGKPFALMPFQRAGVEFCVKRPAALIGDAPGLGKTLQAIGVANCVPDFKRGLFVCPATLKSNWYREIKLWLVHPNKSVGIAQGSYWPDTDIIIVNYDILLRHKDALEEVDWDLVVLDEAHYIKSAKAQRTAAILGNKKKGIKPLRAKRRLALTGTPILNRPGELFSILHWLDPNAWPSRFYFAQRYCAGGYGMYDGASNLEELQLRLRSTLLVRRLKEDVLKELPSKLRSVVEYDDPDLRLEIEEEVRSMRAREAALASLRAAVELAKASDNPQEYKAAVEALRSGLSVAFAEISELRARTAIAKIPHVIAHVKDIIENTSDKVVVFAHHREVVERICSAFPWLSVKLYGGMSEAAKDASVTAFQTDPNVRIFVGSILAAGVGLTLTAAHRVVFAELDWTPSNVTQAEDRCILEGQPVLTPEGWRPIEGIRVGDMVIGRDGNEHRVVDAWSRGCTKPITEITVRGWPEALKTTHDHPFLVEQVAGSVVWKQAAELAPGDCLAAPRQGRREDLSHLALDIDRSRYAKNGRRKSAPEEIALDADALFVFGYFVGDGFASTLKGKGRFVSFSGHQQKDAKAFERISAWFAKYGLVGHNRFADGLGMEMRFYSAEWAQWFEKSFGMTAHGKKLPAWVWRLSDRQQSALLEGLAASDGYNRDGKGRIEYVTASDVLASQVYRLALNANLSVGKRWLSTGHHVITWSSRKSGTCGRVSEVLHRFPAKGSGPHQRRERVYDLTVEGSASFVVGGAVVHNCHRIGQKDTVLVQHIVLSGSLDATIARKLVAKQSIIDRALDEVERLEHDSVIPTTEPELEEVARIEDLDRDAHTFSPEDRQKIYQGLHAIDLDAVGNPVEVIVTTRLREIPLESMNNRQVALAYRVCARNLRGFSLTGSPAPDTIHP